VTQTPAKRRIVIACSGSSESLAAIPRLASAFDAEVVTLTLDIGQSRELEGVRQAALAAGAVRAHVLDAREEFARECIVALQQEHTPTVRALIARKLDEVAHIEGATAVVHAGVDDDVEATLWERSPGKPELNEPARLEIAFERGLPVSVNGVPMTLTELIESIATIADAPPAAIFQAAHEALGDASSASEATVCLELFKGQHRVLSAHRS
jgi:argininosuccinate synthase